LLNNKARARALNYAGDEIPGGLVRVMKARVAASFGEHIRPEVRLEIGFMHRSMLRSDPTSSSQ
jgi:hypothetical protein